MTNLSGLTEPIIASAKDPASRDNPLAKPDTSGLPADARLKTPPEFRRVFDSGKKQVGRYFVVFTAANGREGPRLGLAVSRRVGNAVLRNRLKRHIRESFRQHKAVFGSRDVVVVARGTAAQGRAEELRRELARCWRKIGDA